MLQDVDRHGLFHEIHRSIEATATRVVEGLMAGTTDLTYPPNNGLLPEEIDAVSALPKSHALASALRKIIADASAAPIFDLLCLVDGVADVPKLEDVLSDDASAEDLMLHDGLYDSYWAWRRRRPDPGWRLDTYEGV